MIFENYLLNHQKILAKWDQYRQGPKSYFLAQKQLL